MNHFHLFSSAPTAGPQNAVGYAVDSESIFLQWNPPPFEHQNGIIRNYIINATEVDTGVQFRSINTVNTQYTLRSLHPYYTYQFVISAVTVAPGPPTIAFSIQTNQDGKFATGFSPAHYCLFLQATCKHMTSLHSVFTTYSTTQ